jgi:hypothetical protein
MIGAALTVSAFCLMVVAAVCFEVKSIRRQRYFNGVIDTIDSRVTQIRERKRSTPGSMPVHEMRMGGSDDTVRLIGARK